MIGFGITIVIPSTLSMSPHGVTAEILNPAHDARQAVMIASKIIFICFSKR